MQEGERLVKVQYFRRYKGGGNKELKYLSLLNFIGLKNYT